MRGPVAPLPGRVIFCAMFWRTGNGTMAPQWLYVKMHFPFFWVWKIGITGSILRRTRENNRRVWGFWIPVACTYIPYAYQLEQRLLNASAQIKLTILGKGGVELRPIWWGLFAAVLVYILGAIKWFFIILFFHFLMTFMRSL